MNNLFKYTNTKRTVLITGATSGIGKEVAVRFAKEGWDILCHFFSSMEKAKELKKTIEGCGAKCHLFKANLSLGSQLQSFINKLAKFRVDCLINNAGSYIVSKHFSELTLNDVTATFMVNTFAPILLTANIFMRMKEKRFGRIVNISSIAAKYGGSGYSMHYGCAKLALEGLTKTLSREGAEYNVLANTIRPGVIDTEFHKKYPKDMEKRIAMIPLKRMGTPKEVADMVYYLGSDENKFITNETITISGGE